MGQGCMIFVEGNQRAITRRILSQLSRVRWLRRRSDLYQSPATELGRESSASVPFG